MCVCVYENMYVLYMFLCLCVGVCLLSSCLCVRVFVLVYFFLCIISSYPFVHTREKLCTRGA